MFDDPTPDEPIDLDPTPEPEPEAKPVDPNVKLRGKAFLLTPPASYAERLDLRSASGVNWRRGCAGALVACLPERTRKELGVTIAGCGYDLQRYGGECLDALAAKKITLDDILTAGFVALQLCRDVDGAEVEAAAKN